ncbi:UPF0147 family protein [Candidatus Woesearchaeota archaeon]|nr:UPF0147 family protein [Candidatus Woesearchaeota archaeon]
MTKNDILEPIEILMQIEVDQTIPKNVKQKIRNAIEALKEEDKELAIKANRALQELVDVADDPNIPPYVRPQIWNVVSLLEGI